MILSISDIEILKNTVTREFPMQIHFHDGCGGQYFTVDEPTEELKAFLCEYFSKRKLKVRFSESGDSFTVEEIS